MTAGPAQGRGRGDRGAVLILSSLLMIGLLMVAAIVLDVANNRQNDRQVQSAADAAALAAGQDLPDLLAAMETVKTYAEENFDVDRDEWVGCQDSGALALRPDLVQMPALGTYTINNNACISFNVPRTKVRVRIPAQPVPTFLANIFGTDNTYVAAHAEAGAIVTQSDRIIPAAISGSIGTGLVCVEQSGSNTPCSNRDRGQFGSLYSPRLNFLKPASNVNGDGLAINYAMNLDHDLQPWDGAFAGPGL